MSKPRKTVWISDLVDRANNMLSKSVDEMSEGRMAVAVFVESVLFDADAYAGYNHLRSEYLPAEEQTPDNVLREGYDDTRRHYYLHRSVGGQA